MLIKDVELLSVAASDIDSDGVLRIPEGVKYVCADAVRNMSGLKKLYLPDSLVDFHEDAFLYNRNLSYVRFGRGMCDIPMYSFGGCHNVTGISFPSSMSCIPRVASLVSPRLKTVECYDKNENSTLYKTVYINDAMYIIDSHRQICGLDIVLLRRPSFVDGELCGSQFYGIKLGDKCFCDSINFSRAIYDARKSKMLSDFSDAVSRSGCSQEVARILCDSARFSFVGLERISRQKRIQFYDYVKSVPTMAKNVQAVLDGYEYKLFFGELSSLTLEKLNKIITPINYSPVLPASTRVLKRAPVSSDKMFEILSDGIRNPGAFPFSWLEKTPYELRGQLTARLHDAFRDATRRIYMPQTNVLTISDFEHMERVIGRLSATITKLCKIPVEISYLGQGNFAKAYKITTPSQTCVYKIYHSDQNDAMVSYWAHDTEIQNSFLISGKKLSGRIRFRPIYTGGVSNIRGLRYLIYPYIDGEPCRVPDISYRYLRMVHLFDNHDGNCCRIGSDYIITDTGALLMNMPLWRDRYVRKIVNSVLYHGWDALTHVLKTYNKEQIAVAADIVSNRIVSNDLNYKLIISKLKFLRDNIR